MQQQHCGDRTQTNKGQVAILVAVFFMLISAVVSSAVVALGVSQLKVANEFLLGKKSFATAESGIEDVALRVADTLNYVNDDYETVTIANQGNASVSVSSIQSGNYTLTTTGNVSQRFRQLKAKFTVGRAPGTDFIAALTAGYLGVILDNSVQIQNVSEPANHGNVFSNGTVDSRGTSDRVTGEIRVARPIAEDATFYQAQIQASTNWYTHLRDTENTKDVAMSFIADKTAYVTEIQLLIDRNVLNPAQYPYIYVRILQNEAGFNRPLRTDSSLSVRALSASDIPYRATPGLNSPLNWVKIRLNTNRPVYENERYWIVLDSSGTNYANYFRLYGAGPSSYIPTGSCYKETWCAPKTADAGANELTDDRVGMVRTSPHWEAASPQWFVPYNKGAAPSDPQPQEMDIAFKVVFGEPTYLDQNDPLNISNPHITKVKTALTGGAVHAHAIESTSIGTDVTISDKSAYYKHILGTVTAGSPTATQCFDNSTAAPCVGNTEAPDPYNLIDIPDGKHFLEKIQEYKDIASASTFTGTKTVANGEVARLGPLHITDNLVLNGSSTLKVSDVVWVGGKLDLNNTCNIYHVGDPNEVSIILVTGGKITAGNSCNFYGNGSNIVIMDTYYDPLTTVALEPQNTINFANTVGAISGDVVLFAPFGEVRLANSAEVTAISAAKITAINSGTVKYSSTLMDLADPGSDLREIPVFTAYYESQ